MHNYIRYTSRINNWRIKYVYFNRSFKTIEYSNGNIPKWKLNVVHYKGDIGNWKINTNSFKDNFINYMKNKNKKELSLCTHLN